MISHAYDGKPIPLEILDEINSKSNDITFEYFLEKDCLLNVKQPIGICMVEKTLILHQKEKY